MISDPIGDMLARIKNGYQARHGEIRLPYSGIKHELAKVLVEEGFLKSVTVEENGHKELILDLKYQEGKKPAIEDLVRVSKPSRHLYVKATEIKPVFSGLGIKIVSTSKGLMTGKKARKQNLGGEVICHVW